MLTFYSIPQGWNSSMVLIHRNGKPVYFVIDLHEIERIEFDVAMEMHVRSVVTINVSTASQSIHP